MATQRVNITDRAHRYRAQNAVTGPKRCVICGSRSDIQVMHLDGDESHGEPGNLAYGCRSCNGKLSAAFKRAGIGRPTNQYNPASGAVPTFDQYAWAVSSGARQVYSGGSTRHAKGVHDEAGAVIHATPHAKRVEYAREIARRSKSSRQVRSQESFDRWNPGPVSIFDDIDVMRDAHQAKVKLMQSSGINEKVANSIALDSLKDQYRIAVEFRGIPSGKQAVWISGWKHYGRRNPGLWDKFDNWLGGKAKPGHKAGQTGHKFVDSVRSDAKTQAKDARDRSRAEELNRKYVARLDAKDKADRSRAEKRTDAGTYKGYRITRTADGEYFSSLDPSSWYETKGQVQRAIDGYAKGRGNPAFVVVDPEQPFRTYRAPTLVAARARALKLSLKLHSGVEIRQLIPGDPFGKRIEMVGGNPANPGVFLTPVFNRKESAHTRYSRDSVAEATALFHELGWDAATLRTRNEYGEVGPRIKTLKKNPTWTGRRMTQAERDAAYAEEASDQTAAEKHAEWVRAQSEKNRKRNPATASADAFQEFHGFAPSEVVTVTKRIHHHEHLAALGTLVYVEVWGVDQRGHKIAGFKKAVLACNEDMSQLFIEGGDQSVNLQDFGIRKPREMETLGRVTDVAYQTNKTHLGDEGGNAVYVHKFRSTNQNGKHVVVKIARYPDLIYDVVNQQLLFSGGSYEILREGIDK